MTEKVPGCCPRPSSWQRFVRQAVFASSDLPAVGALCVIHEAGLSIPEDIAVVSFDGTSKSEFSWPQLATIRQPINDITEAVLEAALAPQNSDGNIQLLATELIIRRSCGC